MSPAHLLEATDATWKWSNHLKALNVAIVELARGDYARLLVLEPPQHGKSTLISRATPAWYLGRHHRKNEPCRKVLLASYEAGFASSWGRRARNLLEEHGGALYGRTVAQDSSASDRWHIAGCDCGMETAGVGGPFVGKGAGLLIIDDPIKNAEEANSALMRDSRWDWWQSTARPRLAPDGKVIVTMPRWHDDDFAGRLIESMQNKDGEAWRVVRLPAIAEEDDAIGRAPGEALWPEMRDLRVLNETRAAIGSYWWNAQYQLRPQAAAGSIFKREQFRYFVEREDHFDLKTEIVPKNACRFLQTVDLAASLKTQASFFVVLTYAVTPKGQRLFLDVLRARVEGPDQLPLLWRVWKQHNTNAIGVERVAYQLAFVQAAQRAGLPVIALETRGDKVARALAIAAMYERGDVYHRAGAPWVDEFEQELCEFPRGAHDDQVDVAAYSALSFESEFAWGKLGG